MRYRERQQSRLRSHKILWTSGNLLMLLGLYIFLFTGGLLADERYLVYAASGGNDTMAPVTDASMVQTDPPVQAVSPAAQTAEAGAQPTPRPAPVPAAAPDSPSLPTLNEPQDELSSAVLPPTVEQEPSTVEQGPSTITRIVIPTIRVDKKVVEVGWTVQRDVSGQAVAVWDVDKYRVGHHTGTSNPGGGGNIVLAGHSGGPAYPFNDIYYLTPGDPIQLYSAGNVYEYRVSEHILLDEVGQPLERRIENARYIGPTEEEVITMVACWPLTGPDKFTQRIVIRATPANPEAID